jgi:hypothetical protein
MLPACGGGSGGSPSAPTSPEPSIGPAGGTVTAANGAVRLVVPAGALSAPVPLTVRAANGLPLDPHAIVQTAFAIEPAGTSFSAPATVVLRYDPSLGPSGVAEPGLRVHVLTGGEWEAVGGASTDVGANEASARISTAGTYAVRWIGPDGPCSSSEDRQFDFWLGSWDYHQGTLAVASNEITKEGGGCLVEEHFQDPTGVRGRSVSLFSRTDRHWHQTYIDSRGGRLVLVGGVSGRRMILNQGPTNRFTWDPVDADTVRYVGEQSADGGRTWTINLDAQYTRR